ncbi:hypothetical protein BDN72DRAFT_907238 [Pluteus cervinus]|uniref:Uncharacterized protein n=1 Tax=Pluteus cervinus TaxID=181527 RepID=A0ACD2ZXK2_9AGAR|nr:hypothetical protein BDN72DRAFT_907238 [Pluteus cervinus]
MGDLPFFLSGSIEDCESRCTSQEALRVDTTCDVHSPFLNRRCGYRPSVRVWNPHGQSTPRLAGALPQLLVYDYRPNNRGFTSTSIWINISVTVVSPLVPYLLGQKLKSFCLIYVAVPVGPVTSLIDGELRIICCCYAFIVVCGTINTRLLAFCLPSFGTARVVNTRNSWMEQFASRLLRTFLTAGGYHRAVPSNSSKFNAHEDCRDPLSAANFIRPVHIDNSLRPMTLTSNGSICGLMALDNFTGSIRRAIAKPQSTDTRSVRALRFSQTMGDRFRLVLLNTHCWTLASLVGSVIS